MYIIGLRSGGVRWKGLSLEVHITCDDFIHILAKKSLQKAIKSTYSWHREIHLPLFYIITHLFLRLLVSCTNLSTSSNNVSKFSRVREEHSMYLHAPMASFVSIPCDVVTGLKPCDFRCSITFSSFLKSSFVPTRNIGVFGQWRLTSGYH